jgi:hypothetical protein
MRSFTNVTSSEQVKGVIFVGHNARRELLLEAGARHERTL